MDDCKVSLFNHQINFKLFKTNPVDKIEVQSRQDQDAKLIMTPIE